MQPDRFDDLHSLIVHKISREDTVFRKAIPSRERLAVTLHFLATGDSQQSISYSYRIGNSTVSSIISETCDAIFEALKDNYMSMPKSSDH